MKARSGYRDDDRAPENTVAIVATVAPDEINKPRKEENQDETGNRILGRIPGDRLPF